MEKWKVLREGVDSRKAFSSNHSLAFEEQWLKGEKDISRGRGTGLPGHGNLKISRTVAQVQKL